ncbi:unnamed protein product [Clonostachys rosea]|uniref:Amino acid permease/ SLC12A domain-containing protein n=1 Tax=Bionectria ochroleuca TaxID=29856 RepID=A0ABY6UGG5_BIOOC|nr:unnamed protein product [Clonostachys rosea]
MVSWLHIRGSIYELAAQFVDPALGFAMGWTYFFAGAMLVCTEFSAVATVMEYWNIGVNPAVWITMCLVVCYFLNMVAVKWYGETEFIMGSTKVLLLIGLVLVTIITMSGSTSVFLSICISVRYAVFTMAGPDNVALSVDKIRNPRKTISSVAKMIISRIMGIYITGVLAVGIICPSHDPRLMGAIDSGEAGEAASPWVNGLLNVGVSGFLPGVVFGWFVDLVVVNFTAMS